MRSPSCPLGESDQAEVADRAEKTRPSIAPEPRSPIKAGEGESQNEVSIEERRLQGRISRTAQFPARPGPSQPGRPGPIQGSAGKHSASGRSPCEKRP